MDRGIFVALSGAVSQEKRLDLLTDNIANVNTPGFKKQKPIFEDIIAGASAMRAFSVTRHASTDMTQGFTERTERRLDLALNGKGFFVVKTPAGERYTRNGTFSLSEDGTLVTTEGFPVEGEKGPVHLRGDDVRVDVSGKITERGVPVDTLKIVAFEHPELLKREGNFFQAPGAVEMETGTRAGTEVVQGYLEKSNVNAVRAMTEMIEAMRAYETQSKVIQTMDDMTRRAIDEVGRGG